MRDISTSLRAALGQKYGIEPVIVVGVKWSGSSETFYSSHDMDGTVQSVVAITSVDMSQRTDGTGGSQSVTVTLSDTRGDLAAILDTIDIHKKVANVYLHVPSLPLSEALSLVDGEINSEMVWDDTARTLTFTILSRTEGRQFGFAAEDGLFEKVDETRRSVQWPFRFGTTCNEQTVEMRNGIRGFLRTAQGVVDPTLDDKICQANKIACEQALQEVQKNLAQGVVCDYIVEGGVNSPQRGRHCLRDEIYRQSSGEQTNQLGVFSANAAIIKSDATETAKFEAVDQGYLDCQKSRAQIVCSLLATKALQEQYAMPTMMIANGECFPQNQQIAIRANDVVFIGTLVGELFTISSVIRSDIPDNPVCSEHGPLTIGYRELPSDRPDSIAACEGSGEYDLEATGGTGEGFRTLDQFECAGFIWLPAGTEVVLEQVATRVHIVSMVPGTVLQVSAYRTLGTKKVLTEVPTDYYTVATVDYGDLEVVEVRLRFALSFFPDENWDDELYVTFESDVGPNPTEVIQWIVERFTDLSIDAVSFSEVAGYTANYPCNYSHRVKEDALTTINRIAREARCGIRIDDGVVKIVYLPREPDSVRTFDQSKIVNASFSYSLGTTESLVTSSEILWQQGGAPVFSDDDETEKFTVENNVARYGHFGNSETYKTITNEPQALKTATFWSIRESNSWRRVKFSAFIEDLDLEIFDCITINYPGFPVTKGIIEGVKVNVGTGIIELEVWTPILSGTTEEYFWAWPATKPSGIPYPSEVGSRPVPALSISPPAGHPLYIASPNPPSQATAGDPFPSDVGDVFPDPDCRVSTGSELVDVIQPQFEQLQFDKYDTTLDQIAARQDQANRAGMSGDLTGSSETRSCGGVNYSTPCMYEVEIIYITPTLVATQPGPGCDRGIGPCNNTGSGNVCAGNFSKTCFSFGNKAEATAFYESERQQAIARFDTCNYTIGQPAAFSVGAPEPVEFISSLNGDQCFGLNDPDVPGQSYQPDVS